MDEFRIAHFKIERELGQGGNGCVYQALDESLGRRVALKVIRPEMAQEPKALQAFLKEAHAAAAINHPNVVQIYFVGEMESYLYIVMEWLQGQTLDHLLEESGRLTEPEVISLALQTARGLRAGHQLGFIHRDIKPENLFLDERHGLKILDFGLASFLWDEDVQSQNIESQSCIVGSPYYVPPERLTFSGEDHRSDIYSLGATLYHAISGRPPFDAENVAQLAAQRLHEPPPSLASLTPKISARISDIIEHMLRVRPDERPQTYEELIHQWTLAYSEAVTVSRPLVAAVASADPVSIPSNVPVVPIPVPSVAVAGPRRKNRKIFPWVVGPAALGGLLLFFLFSKPSGDDSNVSSPAHPVETQPAARNRDDSVPWDRITLDDVGKTVIVAGIVIEITSSRKTNYLHFSPATRDSRALNLMISDRNLQKFPGNLKVLYLGKFIRASGIVSKSRTRPHIVVDGPEQITVVKTE